jgi:DNA-binding SARP family transcriptional activator
MIQLHCLGPVRLSVNGADPPPALLWRKNLALLVYLACSPKGRSREHLIGLLWSDKDDAKARHSLNEALRVLRRTLGEALETDGAMVRIKDGAIETDLGAAAGQSAVFLEDITIPDAPEFERWVAVERERRHLTSLTSLTDEAAQALNAGAVVRARELAERALAVDPHDEPAARALMRAHALAGARTRALAAFASLGDVLRRDLDLAPDKDTVALAELIKAGRVVGGRATGEPSAEPLPLFGAGPSLLARLLELWAVARRGTSHLIVLRGDPGTGKTRLLADLAARARLDGAVVASARALEGEPAESLWRALLRNGLEVPELGGVAPSALAGLAILDPDLATRFPAARNSTGLPPSDAVLSAVLAIADQKPVLLLLDDAHVALPRALASLAALAERARRAPIAVVLAATATPHPALDEVQARLGRDLSGATLATAPLAIADVTALVHTVFPSYEAEAAGRLARRVLADSTGNPFLAVELVTAVHAGLVLDDAPPGAWPEAHRTLDQTLPSDLPPSISAALRVRYSTLSAAAQSALAAVAVLGDAAPVATLARAAELHRPDLEAALDELEWQRWLVGDSEGYHFVTRLAREVILAEMVTGGQRRRMRERAGVEDLTS